MEDVDDIEKMISFESLLTSWKNIISNIFLLSIFIPLPKVSFNNNDNNNKDNKDNKYLLVL